MNRLRRIASNTAIPAISYDFDQGDDGSLFIAMEYVDGGSLSEIIKHEAPLNIGRVVRLESQITERLGERTRLGVIHRDIKPDNIMVVGVGEKEEVKLMDFGIARLRDIHITEAESLRDRGAFSLAMAELEKARLISPTDMAVKAEIERTRRVCLAEKKLGLTEERCD